MMSLAPYAVGASIVAPIGYGVARRSAAAVALGVLIAVGWAVAFAVVLGLSMGGH